MKLRLAAACALAAFIAVAPGVASARAVCSVHPSGPIYRRLVGVSENGTSCRVATDVSRYRGSERRPFLVDGRVWRLTMTYESISDGGMTNKYRSGSATVWVTMVNEEV